MPYEPSAQNACAIAEAELRRQGRGATGYKPPLGYQRYVRIPHPLDPGDGDDEPTMTWSTVAHLGSVNMGARTTWGDLRMALDARTARQSWFAFDLEPVPSTLPRAHCAALSRRLVEISTSPWCIFGAWGGYADLNISVARAPSVDVVHRKTHVLVRRMSDGVPDTADHDSPVRRFRAPNLWLAADRQWLVTTELYSLDTIVAGTASVIDAVKTERMLEVIDLDQSDLRFVS